MIDTAASAQEHLPPQSFGAASPTAPPLLHAYWSGHTDVGRIRRNNEDAFLALAINAQEVRYLGKIGDCSMTRDDLLFAVSDGMGGEQSGEFASRIAVEKITRLMPRYFSQTAVGLPTAFGDLLEELFAGIHAELTHLGASYIECRNMGATLSLGWFVPGWMYFGHIGDSRIYYLPKDGEMTQITQDDSHVGWLRRQGKINEREQRTHPRRNVLAKALGAGHQYVTPQVGAVACQAGDRFLFCTDGLIDGMWDRAIAEQLAAPAVDGTAKANELVQIALKESGRDNITAVVVELRAE